VGRGRPEEDPDAERWLREFAASAPARSKYRLAVMYLTGEGIQQDSEQALYWFREASDDWGKASLGMVQRLRNEGLLQETAAAGFPEAQLLLGDLYAAGDGVPLSREEAAKWHYLAANHGYAEAQMTLAWAFGKGKGVTRDHGESARWFRKAAEQGHVEGQYQTGLMLRDGVGVAPDPVAAHMWLNLAASQGHQMARTMRDELAKRLTRRDREKAEGLAVAWWLDAKARAEAEE
jgi:TPR repeat protein